MPGADQILFGLRTITIEWPGLAIFWHVLSGALAVALAAGWRPAGRDLGLYLVLPFISVSALAWLYGNPFNGMAFASVGFLLLLASMFLGRQPASPGPIWMIVAGIGLFAFGWAYPHFLDTESWLPYLYRAPMGLIPCPTLAAVIGVSLVFDGFTSRAWSWLLGLMGLFYGVFGAAVLGVEIDWALAAGAVVLLGRDYSRHRFAAAAAP